MRLIVNHMEGKIYRSNVNFKFRLGTHVIVCQ